jgi:hypothetical protein
MSSDTAKAPPYNIPRRFGEDLTLPYFSKPDYTVLV